ncbi:ROK family protein [Demequina sp.]|uniref:ROK family protein n=1 Tax=Demequina sp. TaxID=2050685 RepID=UPI0025ED01B2|nr:ROK family protein [Demequina sp.]
MGLVPEIGRDGAVRVAARLPGDAAADPSTLRSHNLGIVMRMLRDRGTLSRKDIEHATGMVPASVTNLLADLSSRGLVRDLRAGSGETRGRGRPRVMVELVPDRCLALAVRIERTRVTGELHSSTGHLLDSSSRRVELGWGQPGDVAHAIAALVARAEGIAADHAGVLLAAVVTVPGPVGHDNRVADSADFGWGHLQLVDLIRAAGASRSLPIEVVNDANAAALAEYASLTLPRPDVMLYLEGGSGVGGGVIADGRILMGARGFGGELGHVTVDWRGRMCRCGSNGCLEAYIGPEGLLASARLTELAESIGRDAAMDEFRARLDRGEKRVVDVALRAGDILGAGVRSIYDVVNPSAIVLGGYLAGMRRWLEPGIQLQLAPRTERLAPLTIESGRLGRRAGLAGAARHGLLAFFDDPTMVPPVRREGASAEGA